MTFCKSAISIIFCMITISQSNNICLVNYENTMNKCIDFNITAGTGCEWMCNYCARKPNRNQ